MVRVAMSEDVMSLEPIGTEGHNNDGLFVDITGAMVEIGHKVHHCYSQTHGYIDVL
jgi:hypothetical protein